MAAEDAWKTRFLELVEDVAGRCPLLVAWKITITYARGFLAAPMRVAAAEEALALLPLPEQALEEASGHLTDVMSLLGSAKELARPDPLPRILGLPNMTPVRRDASRNARDARMLATEAYHAMELCCDCLLDIRLLLHHTATLLPNVDDVIEGMRAHTVQHLVKAREKVDACTALANSARQDVSAAAD